MNYGKTLRAVSIFMLIIGIFSIITAGIVIIYGDMAYEKSEAYDEFLNSRTDINDADMSVMLDNRKVTDAGDIKMMGAGIAASGIVLLIYGILNIIRGFVGFNTEYNKNYFTAIILSIIGILAELFMLFTALSDGSSPAGLLVKGLYVLISILYIYCANALRIKNDEEEAELLRQAAEAAAQRNGEDGEGGENGTPAAEDENRVKTIDDEAAEFFK